MNLTYLEIDHNRVHFDRLNRARGEFFDRLVMGWIYHEHALEGVVLSGDTLMRALERAPVRNWVDGQVQQSLLKLKDCTGFLYESAQNNVPITVEFIRELHVRLCDPGSDTAGRYRKRDTSPGVYNLNICPHGSVSYFLHKVADMAENDFKDVHPVRAASIVHWEYMRVFPFDEKSGLVGRLLMNYMLIRAGYPPAIIHQKDRPLYFSALDGHRTDLVEVLVDAISSTISAAEAFSSQYLESDRHGLAL